MSFIVITVFAVLTIAIVASGAILIIDTNNNPYYENCREISKAYEEFTTNECLKFAEKYPDSTGQDVIDYYTVEKAERLADKKLASIDD